MANNKQTTGKIALIVLLLFAWSSFQKSQAQESSIKDGLFTDDYRINPEKNGSLDLSIDNLNFFKDNENDGDIFDGYTLPGFRFQPHVTLYPSPIVKLEAGLSLLRFWGADKYPCSSYQDIAEWKPSGYQYGFHALPFFRAQIQPIKQIDVIFGMLYGGSNHNLIEPLYNPELNLTADPECGAQFLYDSRIAHVDIWANWESFTFRDDMHNEAFTVGTSAALNLTPKTSFFNLSLPAQMILVHRGGEIDTVFQHVKTMINVASGLKFQLNFNRAALKNISFQTLGFIYEAPVSEDLIYKNGWAFYSNLTATIWNVKLKAAYWKSSDYINIFGNPVYENISLTLDGRIFPKIDVWNGEFNYEQPFGGKFYLGADAEFFYNPHLVGYDPESYGSPIPSKISKSFNFSFGLYLRINPSILLSKKIFK